MPESLPEPWLRGPIPTLHPVIGHLVHAAKQIREDLAGAIHTLSAEEIWAKPRGLTSAGFHAKHLAGSTRRLCAYLEGRGLADEEIAAIAKEKDGEENAAELFGIVESALDLYERQVRELKAEEFGSLRYVGRARLPVCAVSLAIHIAEHGQRHVGQAISAARLACQFTGRRPS